MHQMTGGTFVARPWELSGRANLQQFSARWQGLGPDGRVLTEARVHVKITPRPAQGDTLLITVDALLTDSRRPTPKDELNLDDMPELDFDRMPRQDYKDAVEQYERAAAFTPTPVIRIGALHKLMLDITTTLWGPAGETLSTGILGQPLGPPALLDLTTFATPILHDAQIPPLNERIDFGTAQLIPGNTPGTWTNLGPIQPDRTLLSSPAAQAPTIHDWLIQLGIDNGYQGIEQEISSSTRITA